jgi:protein-S-isoprenylcysteine O-methyltransferase Ste14
MAVLGLIYGIFAYVVFLATFLYAIGFVGGIYVPKSIDVGNLAPLSRALPTDVLLLGLFALQHSVMARPAFKRVWTTIIAASIERSTFVLASSLVLILLFWQWRPMPALVWQTTNPAGQTVLHALFFAGWLLVLASTFMIDHFDLFGLRQVWLNFCGLEYTSLSFSTGGLYRYVRHPIMLGFVIAFWATPTMSVGHLLFALATTGYILIALQLEEHDLVRFFGDSYREYRQRVPMVLPRFRKSRI